MITQNLWYSYYNIDLADEKVRIFYQQSIDKLDGLMNARLAREFSTWERLSPMMWSLLIIGALITICFMFFFGLESLHSQADDRPFIRVSLIYSLSGLFVRSYLQGA